MPRTTKPCPGCGTEGPKSGRGYPQVWRDETEVCSECKTLLQMGKILRDTKQSDDRRRLFALPKHGFEHLIPEWHTGLGRSGGKGTPGGVHVKSFDSVREFVYDWRHVSF